MSSNSCCTKPEQRRQLHLIAALSLLCWMLPVQAADWRDDVPQAHLTGSGELRWFSLQIYSAALWSSTTPFDASQPFALELTYARHITSARLVQTSIDEIRRLSGQRYTEQQYRRLQDVLEHTFTDVKEGDQLIAVFLPGQGCRFYSRSQLLAQVSDPDFAQAFFSIWLDPRSQDAQLRKHLTGVP